MLFPDRQRARTNYTQRGKKFPTPVSSLKFQSLATALIIAVAASLSAATSIIGFDDLDGRDNRAIPKGYAGLNGDNFSNYDAKHESAPLSPSGYDSSVPSPNNVALNGGVTPVTVASNTIFDLNSVYLHSVWRDGLQVRVIGFRAGVAGLEMTFCSVTQSR